MVRYNKLRLQRTKFTGPFEFVVGNKFSLWVHYFILENLCKSILFLKYGIHTPLSFFNQLFLLLSPQPLSISVQLYIYLHLSSFYFARRLRLTFCYELAFGIHTRFFGGKENSLRDVEGTGATKRFVKRSRFPRRDNGGGARATKARRSWKGWAGGRESLGRSRKGVRLSGLPRKRDFFPLLKWIPRTWYLSAVKSKNRSLCTWCGTKLPRTIDAMQPKKRGKKWVNYSTLDLPLHSFPYQFLISLLWLLYFFPQHSHNSFPLKIFYSML